MAEERDIKRGEIYYIHQNPNVAPVGTELWWKDGDRPGIIVSADSNTEGAIIVPLTSKDRGERYIPDVRINSSGRKDATALVDQICRADAKRIGSYIGTLTEEEQAALDKALITYLGLSEAMGKQSSVAAELEVAKKVIERLVNS